jgi:hypothetical protein
MQDECLVKTAVGRVDALWGSGCDAHLFVSLSDGKRPTVSEDRFNAILQTLSLMRCWDAAEAAAPWKTRILYTLHPYALEHPPPNAMENGVRVVVETDEAARVVNTFVFQETRDEMEGITIGTRVFDTKKHYIRRNATTHESVELQHYKRFTFNSSFVWQYELVKSYRQPCTSPDGSSMAFPCAPLFVVTLRCGARRDASRGADYLSHSLRVKLGDLGVKLGDLGVKRE